MGARLEQKREAAAGKLTVKTCPWETCESMAGDASFKDRDAEGEYSLSAAC